MRDGYHNKADRARGQASKRGALTRRQLLGASAGAAFLVSVARARGEDGGEPVKIGVMNPFTGPAARSGAASRKAAAMAIEDARAAGELPLHIDGKTRDLEVVWIDSTSDPEKGVKAVLDAIDRQGVKFIVDGWASSVSMAVMDAEAPYHIVHLGDQGQSQYIAEKLKKDPERYAGFFKGTPSPPLLTGLYGPPLAHFVKEGLWKPANPKVAIVVEDSDSGRGWGAALQTSLKANGFEPLALDVVQLSDTEFTPLFTKYKVARASAVAIHATGSASAANFVKQFAASNIKALMIAQGLTWFEDWYKLTGDASDYAVTADAPRAIAPWQKEWVARYKAKYQEEPSIEPGGISYDYMRMAIAVMNKAGTLDFKTLVKTIRETPYKGVWEYYKFADKAGENALAQNEIETGDFMKGFFFPMAQLMKGEAKVIWPLDYADQKFQQPPWL